MTRVSYGSSIAAPKRPAARAAWLLLGGVGGWREEFKSTVVSLGQIGERSMQGRLLGGGAAQLASVGGVWCLSSIAGEVGVSRRASQTADDQASRDRN